MTEELHATREALWSELFGELEAKFTTKEQLESAMHVTKSGSLSASAPEFVPSSDVLPGPGAGAAHKMQCPQPFGGDAPWDAYKLQF